MERDVAKHWWRSRESSAFHAAPAFTENGLVLGCGTVLLRSDRMGGPVLPDAAHDRLLTLLAVAGRGRLPALALDAIAFASDQWRRGDRALAAIRLAFAPLPRLAEPDDAYVLFLAETALQAGCSPRELLTGLGYAEDLVALLKGVADQPRVPAGSGRASGRWTSGSGASDSSDVREGRSVSSNSAAHHDAGADKEHPVIPVFLRPEHHGEDEILDKPSPFRSESVEEEIQGGHALDLLIPKGGALPFGFPAPIDKPRTLGDDDDKDGPACPPMQNDVGHGASPAAQRFEAMIARLVNPSDPTPKQTPETPNVTSQAYFLPQPDMSSGRVSYDDCKRTSEQSVIPGLQRGDMVDARSEGRSFMYYYPTVRGFNEFEDQVLFQDDALEREGKGRHVFQCVGTERDAAHLTTVFKNQVKHTFFRACHL